MRIIKIVKDPESDEDAYTIEFECVADDSSKLLNELSKSPLGKNAICLLNQAHFMPEQKVQTDEELRRAAEEEEKQIKEHEEKLMEEGREEGRKELREKYVSYIREKEPERLAIDIQSEVEEDKKEDESKGELPKTDENHENAIQPVRRFRRFRGFFPDGDE